MIKYTFGKYYIERLENEFEFKIFLNGKQILHSSLFSLKSSINFIGTLK